jgi:hypothetical protein
VLEEHSVQRLLVDVQLWWLARGYAAEAADKARRREQKKQTKRGGVVTKRSRARSLLGSLRRRARR